MASMSSLEQNRRQRLEQLLQLAGAYKGWNRRQLADALDRDPTKLVPESGNPKLDFVVALADLLDWPVSDVVAALWDSAGGAAGASARTFEDIDEQIVTLHRSGKFHAMLELVPRALALADSPHERAIVRIRESGAWDGLGRYSKAVEALRTGLEQSPLKRGVRLILETNLANAYYSMNFAVEAKAIARDLVDLLAEDPPKTEAERSAQAMAHYTWGQSERVLMAMDPTQAGKHAERSVKQLEEADRLLTALHEEFNDAHYAGVARTCRVGALEGLVALGRMPAADAVAKIVGELEGVVDVAEMAGGDQIESFGWSCIFGANIALRHLPDREMNRAVAILTNKGYEIADRLDNWAMRERLFTLEFLQRQRVNELVGTTLDWMIDGEEVRTIVGAMGRFPGFRQVGWEILRTARVVRNS